LARKVGSTQSVISRMEQLDYDRHSLRMVRRLASAMGMKVEVKLVKKRAQPLAVKTGVRTIKAELKRAEKAASVTAAKRPNPTSKTRGVSKATDTKRRVTARK